MAKVQVTFLVLLILGQPLAANAFLGEVIGAVAGVAAVGVLGPFALAGLGFTTAGITAGSIGASMMAAGVPVAVLQSAGAAGISYSAMVAGGAIGAGAAHGAKHILDED
ncbi:interferon alpha-inducible protein 27-like protein 1 [Biomphalaria glabrata]|uniref:Interferon alpha-inducible protein 27-like protein 1 n=1 Tax=Biomphalaria glabrata TaxID=6526 RepID=A0A9W3BDY9_BIOGL|nr:interferon alpha-inducible protein 27-like protein 1 [Biomphalaria glabrata]